jgi:hypothetical protein
VSGTLLLKPFGLLALSFTSSRAQVVASSRHRAGLRASVTGEILPLATPALLPISAPGPSWCAVSSRRLLRLCVKCNKRLPERPAAVQTPDFSHRDPAAALAQAHADPHWLNPSPFPRGQGFQYVHTSTRRPLRSSDPRLVGVPLVAEGRLRAWEEGSPRTSAAQWSST